MFKIPSLAVLVIFGQIQWLLQIRQRKIVQKSGQIRQNFKQGNPLPYLQIFQFRVK